MKHADKEFALSHGYTIGYYSGSSRSEAVHTTYAKGDLLLDIWPDGPDHYSGKLVRILGLIVCTIGPISIPHPSFEKFEKDLLSIQRQI